VETTVVGSLVEKSWSLWLVGTFGILPLRQAQGQDDSKNVCQRFLAEFRMTENVVATNSERLCQDNRGFLHYAAE
jgi:hypothetical protein